ncbi:uncharacterized protein [Nicotiana sylvestris]|uniref:uncharacterized protein n=1 Tax=Nicotiana sylvestris TaxID=4096 RepID=UPI00388CB975
MAQKHPGFQWSNANGAENPQRFFNQKQQVQGPPGFQHQNRGQQSFQQYQQQPQRAHQQSLEDLMYKFIKATEEKVESQHSAIKNLEIQVSQLATLMSRQIQGALPSNTEKNPKVHLKAISLRSGKSLDDPYADREGKPQEVKKVNKGENKIESKFPKEQKNKGKNVQENELIINPHSVPLPFPQKLKREKLDKKFSKFLEILKQLYINIPFTDALKKLELGEMKNTGVSLQLADQSTKKLKGIIENVLVRVDKFIFPVDFIVLEMEENTKVPLILGKPFLAIGRSIIDVHQGQLILSVDEERVIFDMHKIMKFPEDESSSSCFQIDFLNDLVDVYKDDQLITDALERCLAKSGTTYDDDPMIRQEVEILEKESEIEEVSQEKVQSKIKLKTLPSHLKFIFLEPELFLVIISSSLTAE